MVKINDYQKDRFAQKIIDHFGGDLTGKRIAILGWAFKANTNDSRESAAIYVAEKLYKAGATIEIYDPMVSEQTVLNDIRLYWKLKISTNYKKINILKSIDSSDDYQAFVVLTEWDVFREFKS